MASTLNTQPPPLKAASPPALIFEDSAPQRQSLTLKPSPMAATSPPAGSPGTATSLLSKEWVIPPRPKPGRKPATDTPPTKRKAQNRAAQRAFRERRAARVGELEEQMKLMEEEDEAEQTKLRADIDRLEKEVEQYRDDLTNWIERCRGLENELILVRQGSSSTDAVPLPRRTTLKNDIPPPVDAAMGCGNCSAETNCQCLDEAFNIMNATGGSIAEKRPHSPSNTSSEKRIKTEPNDQEIDFTAVLPSRPVPQTHRDPVDTVEVISAHSGEQDPCGFCSDGTPCICAQMAADVGRQQPSLQHASSSNTTASLPHQLSQQGFTPPPSEGDVSSSVSLHHSTATSTTNPCASGPGTCAQCHSDPKSTLFCKSLAASRSQPSTTAGDPGCCGGADPTSSSCCRSTRSSARPKPQPKIPITLSCADAYTTLSRHHGYERAQDEMAGWMGKLLPVPVINAKEGKTAMEIDAANVMTVLKDFDRRFAD